MLMIGLPIMGPPYTLRRVAEMQQGEPALPQRKPQIFIKNSGRLRERQLGERV